LPSERVHNVTAWKNSNMKSGTVFAALKYEHGFKRLDTVYASRMEALSETGVNEPLQP
jgi:hypothetical protein